MLLNSIFVYNPNIQFQALFLESFTKDDFLQDFNFFNDKIKVIK
jgi:hypothetical protein